MPKSPAKIQRMDVHWFWLGFGSSVGPEPRHGARLNPENRVAIVRGRTLQEAEAEAWRLGVHPMWEKTWGTGITDSEMQQIPRWARDRLLLHREITLYSGIIRAQRGGKW